jgi:hypothetical protein
MVWDEFEGGSWSVAAAALLFLLIVVLWTA